MGGGFQLFLRSRREAEKACDCPWSLCGQCPALWEHTHREKGFQPDPAPPLTHPQNNGKWPPRWHRLPLHTPSVAVALDSSPPSQAVSAKPTPFLSPKPMFQHPAPVRNGGHVSGWGEQGGGTDHLCSPSSSLVATNHFLCSPLKLPFYRG